MNNDGYLFVATKRKIVFNYDQMLPLIPRADMFFEKTDLRENEDISKLMTHQEM